MSRIFIVADVIRNEEGLQMSKATGQISRETGVTFISVSYYSKTTCSELLLLLGPYMVQPLCVHQRWHSEAPVIFPHRSGIGLGVGYVCYLFHCTMSGCQVSATCCPACKWGEPKEHQAGIRYIFFKTQKDFNNYKIQFPPRFFGYISNNLNHGSIRYDLTQRRASDILTCLCSRERKTKVDCGVALRCRPLPVKVRWPFLEQDHA